MGVKRRTHYIFSTGEIKRKGNSIAFKTEKGWKYLPIEVVGEIYFLNEVTLTSKFIGLMGKFGIPLHFFDYYGFYRGSFCPRRQFVSGNLTLKQAEAHLDPVQRVEIARGIVEGIGENILTLLNHYFRHGKGGLEESLTYLRTQIPPLLEKAQSVETLLFLEGQIWATFYESFRHFLPKNFLVGYRRRRPPSNPMNALISFGNSLLYTKTLTAIFQTHLDPTISFLHSPSQRRFSLALDLSEAFKPVLVFRTIFDLINRKRLKVQSHFRREFNYALLTEQGQKIFIQAFEERLEETFFHRKLNRSLSYRTALRLEGYKLIKTLIHGKKFRPFSLKTQF